MLMLSNYLKISSHFVSCCQRDSFNVKNFYLFYSYIWKNILFDLFCHLLTLFFIACLWTFPYIYISQFLPFYFYKQMFPRNGFSKRMFSVPWRYFRLSFFEGCFSLNKCVLPQKKISYSIFLTFFSKEI